MKIELDDQILNHPKFIRAIAKGGSAVIHLWLGLRAYCSQHLTDGFVPDDMFTEVRGPTDSRSRNRATNCLAECNLLHRADGGWTLHDYLDHSSSREQVLAWRKANRDRKRQSRSASQCDNSRDTGSDGKCDGKCDTDVTTSGVPEPSYSLISGLDLRDKEREAQEPKPIAKPSVTKRSDPKTKAPETIEPTEATLAVAKETNQNWQKSWAECRDWAWAKGESKADWQATLRGWMRRNVGNCGGSLFSKAPRHEPPQPNDETNRYKFNVIDGSK